VPRLARTAFLVVSFLIAGQAGAQVGAIPPDAHLKGMWSPVTPWPVIGIHAVLLPEGRVLTYGTDTNGRQTGYFTYDIWDPAAGLGAGHLTLPNGTGTDIFCGSQLVLPHSGAGVLLAGGDNWTGTSTTNSGNNNSNIFNPANNSLTRANNMNRARWYSTATTLPNGETYIQGGSGGTDRPEIRSASGIFRLLGNADTSGLNYSYPRNFVAPDGRVFGYDSNGVMYYVNATGLGSITTVGQLPAANRGGDASAAMFQPGRILQYGGASNGAVVIDITSGTPVVTPTQSMSSQRRLSTATLLPDGKVLATGGSAVWNQMTGVNTTAEMWNPATGTWTIGAAGALARLYHSTALLLPDATVLVAGGGAPGPLTNLNVEIYYPPYLFRADGTPAPRPAIAAAPELLQIGGIFALDVISVASVSRVTLVKTGSVTHGWNMEQRFLELAFTASGSSLSVQSPAGAADAPPGTYLLFLIDSAGVPSVGRIVRIEPAAPANQAPTVSAGADRTITLPNNVALSGTAADDGLPNPPGALTRNWSKVSGPGTVTFSAPSALATTASFSASGVYVLRLTVSDSALVSSDDVRVTVNPALGTGTGLTARYYNDPSTGATKFTTLVRTRTDATVNFDWASGSPIPGVVKTDNFSVRWTGQVQAPVTGNYTFSTVSDDGVRVWINGVLRINNWTNHAPTTNTSAAIPLVAGTRYSIVMEYYERTGGAVARLRWAYPGQATQAIPQSRLFP
jgi:hypothetical protein